MRSFARLALVVICVVSFSSLARAQTNGTATLQFNLLSPGGPYGTAGHIAVVWVSDASDNYVETLFKQANTRQQWLLTWNTKRGTDTYVDGTSTATAAYNSGAGTSYSNPYTVTWDCLDKNNNPLPDGTYKLWIEFTEAHAQGPLTSISFVKDSTPETDNPSNTTNIQNVHLNYVPDPATLSMLAVGGLALLQRRRR